MSTPFVEEDNPLFVSSRPSVLLEKIDELFTRGVGQYVALPQIVVVGDQSSGKSSVLEGLTNLPFPRDSGLCTRFATQIIFRRQQETKISVSVIPAKTASGSHQRKVHKWGGSYNLQGLSAQAFANIIEEVHGVMGLRSGNPMFSQDVLKLEINGPEQQHFSVVDVPGMFRKSTEGVTTREDQDMVRQIVESYMENRRSIMLAVIPANVDIATQEILEMARRVDLDGSRTLGVLTKPDLVDSGAEGAIFDLVRSKKHKLALGWCVVRNPGQKQLQKRNLDRNALEQEFFNKKSPWDKLPKEKVGISKLRERLQEILTDSIRRAFPEVKVEIQRQLMVAKQAMDGLGAPRDSLSDQIRFAVNLSIRYQEIAMAAIEANYRGRKMFDEDRDLRFATWVKNRNDKFDQTMIQHGHKFEFQPNEEANYEGFCRQEVSSSSTVKNDYPGDPIELRTCGDHPDLVDMTMQKSTILETPGKHSLEWLTKIYNETVGFHIASVDITLLATIIEKQTAKWDLIARSYILDVVTMVHTFITKVVKLISPTQRVFDGLMATLTESLRFKYQRAINEVERLLTIERVAHPSTLDQNFAENLERSRQARHQARMKTKIIADTKYGRVVRFEDALIGTPVSNTEQGILDVHDIVKAYYEVARKRFTDNITREACLYVLVSAEDSPLKMFSPSFASSLSTYMLDSIAGEDNNTKSTRRDLQQEISDLEAGKQILM